MTDFTLNAETRSDLGKGASRRLRRNAAQVPAVIYGGAEAPESISLLAKDVAKLLEDEAAYAHVIELNVAGAKQSVIIKALQRHPAKGHVMHADFVRVIAGQKLTATVAIHFMNQEAAVKKGGEISHVISEVEITCLPKDLPEFIEVDLAAAEVGTIIHLSEVTAPAGVEFVALAHGNDLAVANVHAPRIEAEDDAGEATAE